MAQICIQNLTFSYPGSPDNVFENLSLNLDTTWRLGLIGRNGRGKTTLLRLLAGELQAGHTISVPGRVALFPPQLPAGELTVYAVMESLAPGLQLWEAERELGRIGVHFDSAGVPFSHLSPGEQNKVRLAAQFLSSQDYLLIDEPTNHLDRESRRSLSAYLATKCGFLVVSHDRDFLDGCTDHILAINRSGPELCRGNFTTWKTGYDDRQTAEEARNGQLRKEIVRLGKAASRSEQWARQRESTKTEGTDSGFAGHRAAKLMKRAKAAEMRRKQAMDEKKTLLKNAEEAGPLQMFPLDPPKELLLSFSHVQIAYPGTQFPSVSFDLRRGDRIVLEGGNGTGKTSLLELLAGADVPYSGEIRTSSAFRISWLPQDTAGVQSSLKELAASRSLDWTQFLTMLRQLGFPRSHFSRDLADLSEGQRRKALLAASLCERAHLYVWDEPLNYIDLYTRLQLEELIMRVRPTLLMVEHDAAFIETVATQRVMLRRENDGAAAETVHCV